MDSWRVLVGAPGSDVKRLAAPGPRLDRAREPDRALGKLSSGCARPQGWRANARQVRNDAARSDGSWRAARRSHLLFGAEGADLAGEMEKREASSLRGRKQLRRRSGRSRPLWCLPPASKTRGIRLQSPIAYRSGRLRALAPFARGDCTDRRFVGVPRAGKCAAARAPVIDAASAAPRDRLTCGAHGRRLGDTLNTSCNEETAWSRVKRFSWPRVKCLCWW